MARRALVADSVLTPDGVVGEAVVIDGDRIVDLCPATALGDVPATEFPGATILPALSDSHIHPVGYASLLSGISLMAASDVGDLLRRLRDRASELPPGQALVAQRVNDTTLGRLPDRFDLDRAATDRPLLAYRYCGHIAIANTNALELAGIGPTTSDPPGGSLDRDDQGVPTGVLRETAIDLVSAALDSLIPPPEPGSILKALESLAALGLGSIHGMVAAGNPLWCGVGNELELMCEIAHDLPVEVAVIVIAQAVDELARARATIDRAGGRLRFLGWKGFADGSLGGHTASMWQPFVGTDQAGTLRLENAAAGHLARASLDMGGIVAVHAIGDRAIDSTLDLFDGMISLGYSPRSMRVEHLSVASDDAIRRIASSGVVASVQPSFLTSEASWVPQRLGSRRPAYRFATMTTAGVEMVGGSDCPVERPDPLAGIAAAVNRPGWNDGEHLDVTNALGLFCSDRFEVGSAANLVVVGGTVGSSSSEVLAVYRNGTPLAFRPVPWPG